MTLQDWLPEICENETPDSSIVAFNFGLFETVDGYTIYLIGSREYDGDDEDWATNNDFEPAKKYFPLPPENFKQLEWQEVLNNVRSELTKFAASETFQSSFLAAAKAVTTGFDDGNLVLVHQADR